MKGDFSRESFDPSHHYTSVLMQQGRVQLDADWNEQAAIARYRMRAALADLIGQHGGPQAQCGFGVITAASEIDKLAGADGRPLSEARRAQLKQALAKGDILFGTGRYYVDGIMAESDAPATYGEQAGYPFSAESTIEKLASANQFLLYLDVWERHIDALEADAMREVALGGPDTASRVQVVAQVKAVPGARSPGDLPAAIASTARLRAGARKSGEQQEACVIHPEARYRGLENQLYRVEIHRGGLARKDGTAGGATFKWSRENGSVALPIVRIDTDGAANTTTVTLAAVGRDDKLGLASGDWVELADDDAALQERYGALLQVRSVDGMRAVLDGLPDAAFASKPGKHPLLRRWDHAGPGLDEGALLLTESNAANGWIALEDGIEIQFVPTGPNEKPANYRRGDYWLIPARTATGDVEWPLAVGGADGERAALPPSGVRHYYAPLALMTRSTGAGWTVSDLRLRFKGLAA